MYGRGTIRGNGVAHIGEEGHGRQNVNVVQRRVSPAGRRREGHANTGRKAEVNGTEGLRK